MADKTENAAAECRPTRVRATMERFNPEVQKKEKKEVKQGTGTPLGEIDNIAFYVGKIDSKHDLLRALHMVLYGSQGKQTQRKANVRKFSGFAFDGDDAARNKVNDKFMEKRWTVACLKDCAMLLDIADRSGSKEDLSSRITDFLDNPSDANNPSAEDSYSRSRDRKRKRSTGKKTGSKKSSKTSKTSKTDKAEQEGFVVFGREAFKQIKEEHPDWGNEDVVKESKKRWKELSEEEKAPYKQKASKAKAEAEEEGDTAEAEEENNNNDDVEDDAEDGEGEKENAEKEKDQSEAGGAETAEEGEEL